MWLGLIASVSDTLWKSVGPKFKLGNGCFYSCHHSFSSYVRTATLPIIIGVNLMSELHTELNANCLYILLYIPLPGQPHAIVFHN